MGLNTATVSVHALVAAFASTDLTLRTATDQHIERVLQLVDGNLSAAARLLGMHRRSLQRRRKRMKAAAKRRSRRRS